MKGLLISLLITPTLTLADDCTDDYVKHNDQIIESYQSGDQQMELVATAQRDCLALALQPLKAGDSICPTFRAFESSFMQLEPSAQIEEGKVCKRLLLLADETKTESPQANL